MLVVVARAVTGLCRYNLSCLIHFIAMHAAMLLRTNKFFCALASTGSHLVQSIQNLIGRVRSRAHEHGLDSAVPRCLAHAASTSHASSS